MAERAHWTKHVGLVVSGIAIGWAGQQASKAKTASRMDPPRIGYVNIAKVLQHFAWSNQEEAKITERGVAYDERMSTERDVLSQLNMRYRAASDDKLRKELQELALAAQRRIEAIDDEASKELAILRNNKVVAVYEQVRETIAELAKERGLDVVEAFPSATTQKEERSPKVARLTVETPALTPLFVNPNLDFTGEVIARLNKKYPSETDFKQVM